MGRSASGYRGCPRPRDRRRGARPKCVACSLCEYVCPPKAIYIVSPGARARQQAVERGPAVFNINMLRCIYCGLCEEACPEEAIFMSKEYAFYGADARVDLIFTTRKSCTSWAASARGHQEVGEQVAAPREGGPTEPSRGKVGANEQMTQVVFYVFAAVTTALYRFGGTRRAMAVTRKNAVASAHLARADVLRPGRATT